MICVKHEGMHLIENTDIFSEHRLKKKYIVGEKIFDDFFNSLVGARFKVNKKQVFPSKSQWCVLR